MKDKPLELEVGFDADVAIRKVKRIKKKLFRLPPIRISLTKIMYDWKGERIRNVILISGQDSRFRSLVKLLKDFPFVALDCYPFSSADPAQDFRLVKASTGPVRVNALPVEYILSFHGDPKYWKWALISAGLVKK